MLNCYSFIKININVIILLNYYKNFSKNKFQKEFICACIIIGLEYLHQNGILHRDIKPENLVFESNGYLRITDLGIGRIWKPDNSSDTSGTPGYMAPEVMCRQNHGVAVDYYAVGVIAYEIIMGKRPYIGKTRSSYLYFLFIHFYLFCFIQYFLIN